jgi:large subunit ribosomal protein L34
MANLQLYKPSGNLTIVEKNIQGTKSFLENLLAEGIYYLKRTFQPSLLRRRRKHGMLSRLDNRNGRKIIIRRSIKKRRYRAC